MPPPSIEAGSMPAWHTLSVEDVCARLQSTASGLTRAEVARRLKEYGLNELQAARPVPRWKLFARQFRNVLVVVLLVATVISACLGQLVETAAIFLIVLMAAVLGFMQECRTEKAIDALRKMAAPIATVLRDGEEREIPARELVPGDIIILSSGNRVPGDARLVEAVNLQIQESVLTGESVPVEKDSSAIGSAELAMSDRINMAYAGTLVTYGRGRGVIVGTGMVTEFGKIAGMLQTVEAGRTPLQEGLDKVGHVLVRIAIGIVAVIVAIGVVHGEKFVEMLLFGMAVAVAVVPEALPAVVTISLALGVQKLVRRGALVRRLAAVETLGSASVICTDKTGTLTKDEMTVRKVYVAGQMMEVSGVGYEPIGNFSRNGVVVGQSPLVMRLMRAAVLASDAYIVRNEIEGRWYVRGDPTEGALVVAATKAGLKKVRLDVQHPRMGEIPFSPESKRMTTLNVGEGTLVACAKGAPEVILESCVQQFTADGDVALDAKSRGAILGVVHRMANEGMRVLAVAVRSDATLECAEHDMTFVGLIGMIDPPRAEAIDAIRSCREAGIRVVMITGDHPVTAQAVAREVGLLNSGYVISGEDLDMMDDATFSSEVDQIDVYARVSPVHKLRVVTALQEKGLIVAMTGDGVNDAPALKKAAIGIAMGASGTDVAREAAAMTITDDNFASIVAAVEEGRGIFGNIRKYLMYLLSSNVGEIGLVAGAAILGLPLPLTPVQILYVNLATDGLPALALALDPYEPDLMRRKPFHPRQGIFTWPVILLIVVGGMWSMFVNLGLFAWALTHERSASAAMTMTFALLVLIQFFKAYHFRSDRRCVFDHPFANKWLNRAIAWEVLLLLLVVYVPFLQVPFGTVALSAVDWAIVLGLALTISPILETFKWMARRGWFGPMH